ncbi:DoxX family protein [Nocardia sp. CA-290969]|uniref:DoxX family protein n=1 Tax=Nocardia sp. CA-290969 TaxID=3239986 RepID=UPI003D93F10C
MATIVGREAKSVATEPGDNRSPVRGLPATLVFRLGLSFFLLTALTTRLSLGLLAAFGIPAEWVLQVHRPVAAVKEWVASTVFRVPLTAAQIDRLRNWDDTVYSWVQLSVLLLVAVGVTAVWSLADRRARDYRIPGSWLVLAIRYVVGAQLLTYGMAKVFPWQMTMPLHRLIQPYGDFSPMGVLWSSVGSSTSYQICTGVFEVLAGVLLLVPRTARLGALLGFAAMGQVLILNLSYDVAVKTFSFLLMVLLAVLIAPDLRRIATAVLTDREAGVAVRRPLFRSGRRNRIAVIAQVVCAVWLTAVVAHNNADLWRSIGSAHPKSQLYGIWDVVEYSVNGTLRPPLDTDTDRWKRIVFDSPDYVVRQQMDGSLLAYTAAMDPARHTLTLTDPGTGSPAVLTFDRSSAAAMTLTGDIDGRSVRMVLRLRDRESFELTRRGFHLFQDGPYLR